MMNKLKGFRLPEVTLTQLDWLMASGYGSQSQVVVMAISKLYEAAQPQRPAPQVAVAEREQDTKGESNE
jgi:hypothetical protein